MVSCALGLRLAVSGLVLYPGVPSRNGGDLSGPGLSLDRPDARLGLGRRGRKKTNRDSSRVSSSDNPSPEELQEPAREDDTTLGGYLHVHSRPPAFEGCDGQPYTVSIETERLPELKAPVGAYLVFPRWAATGLGVVGHVETNLLWRGSTATEARAGAEALPLQAVQDLLNRAILKKAGVVMGTATDGDQTLDGEETPASKEENENPP